MTQARKNSPPKKPASIGKPPKGMRHEQVQMLGMDPDLVQDLRDVLRNVPMPHKESDALLKRIEQCQVLTVTVVVPDAQSQARPNGAA